MSVTDELLVQAVTSDEVTPAAVRWRRVRWLAATCYASVFAISVIYDGVPMLRVSVVLWTLGAFAVYCIGRQWRTFGRAVLEWLPFTGVMVCYDLCRGAVYRLGRPVHVTWPAAADRWLFDGTVPTVWLQYRLHTPDVVHWYDVAALVTYFSFFLVVPVTMAVLWIRDRRLWRRFTANVVAVSFAALLTYLAFPEAPPWYAAERGTIGTVARISTVIWTDLGLRGAGDLVEHGQAIANDVAAMPSLHEAYTMLVALFFLRRVSRWARPLLLAYPVAMGFALVYTGEHYVIDLMAGVAYVVVVHAVVRKSAAVWDARRTARQPSATDHAALPCSTSAFRPDGPGRTDRRRSHEFAGLSRMISAA